MRSSLGTTFYQYGEKGRRVQAVSLLEQAEGTKDFSHLPSYEKREGGEEGERE